MCFRFRPTLILGLLYFNQVIDVNKLRRIFLERIIHFPRFRSRIILEKKKVYFQEIPANQLNMQYHIVEEFSSNWSLQRFYQFLNEQYVAIKDVSCPLWRVHVLNHLGDGRHCIVIDVDHAIGDGISMVEVLSSLLDDPTEVQSIRDEKGSPAATEVSPSFKAATGIVRKGKRNKSLRSKLFFVLNILIACVTGTIKAFLTPFYPGDSHNGLKLHDARKPSDVKNFAFAQNIPFSRVKELRTKIPAATVNDILMAVLTMTVRRYFEATSDAVLHTFRRCVSASFPINARKPGKSVRDTFGNHVSLGFFHFDLRAQSRLTAFWSVKRQIDAIKMSPQVKLTPVIHTDYGNRVGWWLLRSTFQSSHRLILTLIFMCFCVCLLTLLRAAIHPE